MKRDLISPWAMHNLTGDIKLDIKYGRIFTNPDYVGMQRLGQLLSNQTDKMKVWIEKLLREEDWVGMDETRVHGSSVIQLFAGLGLFVDSFFNGVRRLGLRTLLANVSSEDDEEEEDSVRDDTNQVDVSSLAWTPQRVRNAFIKSIETCLKHYCEYILAISGKIQDVIPHVVDIGALSYKNRRKSGEFGSLMHATKRKLQQTRNRVPSSFGFHKQAFDALYNQDLEILCTRYETLHTVLVRTKQLNHKIKVAWLRGQDQIRKHGGTGGSGGGVATNGVAGSTSGSMDRKHPITPDDGVAGQGDGKKARKKRRGLFSRNKTVDVGSGDDRTSDSSNDITSITAADHVLEMDASMINAEHMNNFNGNLSNLVWLERTINEISRNVDYMATLIATHVVYVDLRLEILDNLYSSKAKIEIDSNGHVLTEEEIVKRLKHEEKMEKQRLKEKEKEEKEKEKQHEKEEKGKKDKKDKKDKKNKKKPKAPSKDQPSEQVESKNDLFEFSDDDDIMDNKKHKNKYTTLIENYGKPIDKHGCIVESCRTLHVWKKFQTYMEKMKDNTNVETFNILVRKTLAIYLLCLRWIFLHSGKDRKFTKADTNVIWDDFRSFDQFFRKYLSISNIVEIRQLSDIDTIVSMMSHDTEKLSSMYERQSANNGANAVSMVIPFMNGNGASSNGINQSPTDTHSVSSEKEVENMSDTLMSSLENRSINSINALLSKRTDSKAKQQQFILGQVNNILCLLPYQMQTEPELILHILVRRIEKQAQKFVNKQLNYLKKMAKLGKEQQSHHNQRQESVSSKESKSKSKSYGDNHNSLNTNNKDNKRGKLRTASPQTPILEEKSIASNQDNDQDDESSMQLVD